jgi:predicted ester cyclase
MPTPEQNKELMDRFAKEVFGNKNLEYAAGWLSDDFVEHQVFPGTTPDRQGALDSYEILFEASPDMRVEIRDMIAEGDRVAIRATYSGTDKGGFIPGMSATGRWYQMDAMYFVRVNDEGKIAEQWGILDTIGTLGQLGLLPSLGEAPLG